MSVVHGQGSPPPHPADVSSRPSISSSYPLEDGEIVDGPLSSSQDEEHFSLQRSTGGRQPRSSAQAGASESAPASLVRMPTPTDEPTGLGGPPMTAVELDRARSLVLDLLGWGVNPEYLVACGLSRGAVHTVFSELRLRVPQNLDAFGVHDDWRLS